jgi:hypothetical protein
MSELLNESSTHLRVEHDGPVGAEHRFLDERVGLPQLRQLLRLIVMIVIISTVY